MEAAVNSLGFLERSQRGKKDFVQNKHFWFRNGCEQRK